MLKLLWAVHNTVAMFKNELGFEFFNAGGTNKLAAMVGDGKGFEKEVFFYSEVFLFSPVSDMDIQR